MACKDPVKTPADNVLDIITNTKILVDALRLAIIHQDNLTKDCFDSSPSDMSKTVESVKKTYLQLNDEFEAVQEEVRAGETRLNNISEEYKQVLEENEKLKKTEEGILSQQTVLDEHGKIALDLRKMLQTYKKLTGVRFDYNDSENILSGYIGIPGTQPGNSTLVPFKIDKENINNKQLLWEKINQACSEISNC